jgi:dolichol-phosphate mannosyltransferase
MLSLVLPTYNEAENLPTVLREISGILSEFPFEIIVVDDDSPDGTWKKAEEISRQNKHVRVLRRVGRRGLSSAVVEGFSMAKGEALAVADADGQHDYAILPTLYEAVLSGAGIAVGSRYVPGGGTGDWSSERRFLSRLATRLTSLFTGVRVQDPMSGFFAIRRTLFRAIAPNLHPKGFKILLDLLARLPKGTTVREIPYTFKPRTAGTSKLSLAVQFAFLWTLAGAVWFRLCRGRKLTVVFILLLLAIAASLAPRIWALRALYLDGKVRSAVTASLQNVSDTHGWILSDMELLSVDASSFRFMHREHRRDPAPPACFSVSLSTSALTPCAK